MTIRTIKRVEVMPMAKLYGAMMAAIGFIVASFFGIVYGFIFGGIGMIGLMSGGNSAAAGIGMLIGGIIILIIMVVLATVGYGIMGFISGAIGAIIYNFFAEKIGGIQLDLE